MLFKLNPESRWALASLLLAAAPATATSPLNFDFPYDATEPVPYSAQVDPKFIKQTVLKASLYRPSIDLLDNDEINPSWQEGSDREFMTGLAKYWAESYDWFEEQDAIFSNGSHYAVTIPEGGGDYEHPVSFHFVHERSSRENAIPLVALHGWPSSHLEFNSVLELLSSPEDPNAQAFHVVVPDLPGFGFSPAPTYSGFGFRQAAFAVDKLMKKLGYDKYAIAGTDLGHYVGLFINQDFDESIIGYYSDFWVVQPNATDLERYAANQTSAEENTYIEAYQALFNFRYPHGPAHSMAPLAIGQAMTDSPVGFAGWMFQLAAPLSDGYPYTLTEIITNTMMLFIQGTYGNIRWYREFFFYDQFNIRRTEVPTGVGRYAFPTSTGPEANFHLVPREWLERASNIVYLETHEEGGHFPSVNVPEVWAEDVRKFFGGLVSGEIGA